jgi:hypothetical protein
MMARNIEAGRRDVVLSFEPVLVSGWFLKKE